MGFFRKPWVPWLGIGLVLSAAILVWAIKFRKTLQPLTVEELNRAMALWKEKGPTSYYLEVRIGGAQNGRHVLEVRDGKVVSITTNSVADPQRTGEYWTVPGMFRTLDEELTLASQPAAAFGVTERENVYLAASFDSQYGYPNNFLRQVFGKNLTVDWEVLTFKPIAP